MPSTSSGHQSEVHLILRHCHGGSSQPWLSDSEGIHKGICCSCIWRLRCWDYRKDNEVITTLDQTPITLNYFSLDAMTCGSLLRVLDAPCLYIALHVTCNRVIWVLCADEDGKLPLPSLAVSKQQRGSQALSLYDEPCHSQGMAQQISTAHPPLLLMFLCKAWAFSMHCAGCINSFAFSKRYYIWVLLYHM